MFFWNSLAFSVIKWTLAIWSLVPLPFQIQLEHQEVHSSHTVEPGLENFEHYFARVWDLGSKITADGECNHEIKRCLLHGRKVMTNLDSILKSRDFTNKGPSSQSYGFSRIQIWMWELDYKESWTRKNWCFWTMVLEKTLESPLDCKIQHINPKRNQP